MLTRSTKQESARAGRRGVGRERIEAARPELALLVVVTFWAAGFVVTKGAFDEISPLAFVVVRFLLMTAMAFGVLGLRGRGKPWRETWLIRRGDLPRFVVAGITGYTGYQLGFVLGLDRTSAFSSALLIAMVPLFTMVWLTVMGEPTTARGWTGLGVAIAGVVIFLAEKWGEGGTLAGDALSLGAAVSFSIYTVINRPLVRDYPVETYTAYSVLAGSVPLLIIGMPAALDQPWGDVSARSWLAVAYMVVFPVYIAYMLWNWAIARRGAASASSFGLLQPVIAGVLSAIFFAEGFGPAKLLGAILVLAGLITVRSKPSETGSRFSSKGEQ